MRNRRVSILQLNPLWDPRRNYVVLLGMIGTALIAVVNLYGHGLEDVFDTTPIPGIFWGIPLAFALGILTMDEIRKLLVRTYPMVSAPTAISHTMIAKLEYTTQSFIAKMAW